MRNIFFFFAFCQIISCVSEKTATDRLAAKCAQKFPCVIDKRDTVIHTDSLRIIDTVKIESVVVRFDTVTKVVNGINTIDTVFVNKVETITNTITITVSKRDSSLQRLWKSQSDSTILDAQQRISAANNLVESKVHHLDIWRTIALCFIGLCVLLILKDSPTAVTGIWAFIINLFKSKNG